MPKFVMRKMADGMNVTEGKLYPRMKLTGTATLSDLARQICGATSFTQGDVKGVVTALVQEMAWQMAQGKSVQIEGLGRFRPRLRLCSGAAAEHEDGSTGHRTARSVRIAGVNFLADPTLAGSADRAATLERQMPRPGRKPAMQTLEERVRDAADYLGRRHSITVSIYARRTGLSRTAATRELRALADDPASPIGARGYGSHKVYVLKSEMQEDDD